MRGGLLALSLLLMGFGGCELLTNFDPNDLPTCTPGPAAINIDTPTSGTTLQGILYIKGVASDCLKVTRVRVGLGDSLRVEAQGTRTWHAYLDLQKVPTGVHTLQAVATNTRGEETVANQQLEVVGFKRASSKLPAFTGTLAFVTDLDGDGHVDLGMTDGVLWGDGKGGFAKTRAGYTGPTCTDRQVPVDLDNDGDMDLVCAAESKVSTWFQESRGVFKLRKTFTLPCSDLRQFGAGDINGDGAIEFLALYFYCPASFFLLNDGVGNLKAVASNDAGVVTNTQEMYWIQHFAFGDMDNDGDLDLVLDGAFGTPPVLYLNQGATGFKEAAGGRFPSTTRPEIVDYDNDGLLDIAFTGTFDAPAPRVVQNQGQLSFVDVTTAIQYKEGPFVDLNGDGWLEPLGAIRVQGSQGAYFLEARVEVEQQIVSWRLSGTTPFDANGDGSLDLFFPKLPHLMLSTLVTRSAAGEARYLVLKLRRTSGGNRLGLGATVELYDAGHAGNRAHIRAMRVMGLTYEARFWIEPPRNYDLRVRIPGEKNSIICRSCSGGVIVIQGATCACK